MLSFSKSKVIAITKRIVKRKDPKIGQALIRHESDVISKIKIPLHDVKKEYECVDSD